MRITKNIAIAWGEMVSAVPPVFSVYPMIIEGNKKHFTPDGTKHNLAVPPDTTLSQVQAICRYYSHITVATVPAYYLT